MEHRMVACDIDGTLLNDDAQITDLTLAALRQCIDRGISVALVTGRRLRSSIEVARMIDQDIPVVANDGAVVLSAPSGDLLHSETIPADRAITIADGFFSAGHPVFLHRLTLDGPDVHYRLHPGFAPAEMYIQAVGSEARALDPMPRPLRWSPVKISTMGARDSLEELSRRLGLQSSSTITWDSYAEINWLQAVAPGCNKGSGLKVLARHLKVAAGDIIAFGDNYNDLPMFEVAGTAVAMDNAAADIKAAADRVAASNNRDGVARFLHEAVLSPP